MTGGPTFDDVAARWPERLWGDFAVGDHQTLGAALANLLRTLHGSAIGGLVRTDGTFDPGAHPAEPGRDRRVLFLCRRPFFTIARAALHLREQGWTTILMHLDPIEAPIDSCLDGAFSARHKVPNSIPLLQKLLAVIDVDVIHMQCWMFDYVTAASIIRARPAAKIVCEFYDITSLFGSRADLVRRFPAADVDLDLAAEAVIYNEADAVITRFSDETIADLRARWGGLRHALTFWPYPSPHYATTTTQARTPGGKRLVYAGGLTRVPRDLPPGVFPDQGLLGLFDRLLRQGFSIDVFHDPYRPLSPPDPLLAPYFDLARRHPTFQLFDGIAPDRAAARLWDYDYGLNVVEISEACARDRRDLVTSGIGTKLFAYLEAGVPVIVNREYLHTAAFVTREEIGLAVHTRDLDRLPDILAATDNARLRAGVQSYCRDHGMDKEIRRLIALYLSC